MMRDNIKMAIESVMHSVRKVYFDEPLRRNWHLKYCRFDYVITDARCLWWFEKLNERVRGPFDDATLLRTAVAN